MPNFTPEDLLRYLYKEAPATESHFIEKSLEENWVLQEKFTVLKTASERLDKIIESPDKNTVSSIMAYAEKKALSVSSN